jgi:hypothetical protein
MDWEELGETPGDLIERRLELHYAAQLVAAVGQTLAPKQPDESQQSLRLSPDLRTWLGYDNVGLEPRSLALFAGEARFPLAGRTMGEGLDWLDDTLHATLALPAHPPDFPHHDLGDSARFPSDGEESRDFVARLFANTQRVLSTYGAPLRLWPHHFDLACTVRGIGAGFSPGDGTQDLPYWYATTQTKPASIGGGGVWQTSPWSGAALPLEKLSRGAENEQPQLEAFFTSLLATS